MFVLKLAKATKDFKYCILYKCSSVKKLAIYIIGLTIIKWNLNMYQSLTLQNKIKNNPTWKSSYFLYRINFSLI